MSALSRKFMHRPSTGSKAAFTLMELLVVMAIFGVLVALLMPVLSHVTERSKRTVCISNLRQLGTALISYGAENNGNLPPPNELNPENSYLIDAHPWDLLVQKNYLPQRSKVYYCPSNSHARYGIKKADPEKDWNRISYTFYPDFILPAPSDPPFYSPQKPGLNGMVALLSDITRYGGDTIPLFHGGRGITAMFTDGSGAFVSTDPPDKWYKEVTTKYPGSTISLGRTELTALRVKLAAKR